MPSTKGKPPLRPGYRQLPAQPPRARHHSSAVPFPAVRLIHLPGAAPEDVVCDKLDRLVCGLEDGRIVRVDPMRGTCETVGNAPGRPLGLEPLTDGRLLICDASCGLLRLDPDTGAIETLVGDIDGQPLRFCSNVTAQKNGTYWFTQSTDRFPLEYYLGAMIEHRPSGRLFRRDPDGQITLVLSELYFPNGISLTEDETALIIAETDGYRLTRFELSGNGAGQRRVIADNLPGFPDNLSRYRDGRFWVAMVAPRNGILDRAGRWPGWVRQLLWRLMPTRRPARHGTTWAMAFDAEGHVLADIQQTRSDLFNVTGVCEVKGRLYFAGSGQSALLEADLSQIEFAFG